MKTSETAPYLSLMCSFFWHIWQLNRVYQLLDTAVSGRDGRIYIHFYLLQNLSRQNALTQLGKFVKNTGTGTMFPLFWKAPHDFQFLWTNKKNTQWLWVQNCLKHQAFQTGAVCRFWNRVKIKILSILSAIPISANLNIKPPDGWKHILCHTPPFGTLSWALKSKSQGNMASQK